MKPPITQATITLFTTIPVSHRVVITTILTTTSRSQTTPLYSDPNNTPHQQIYARDTFSLACHQRAATRDDSRELVRFGCGEGDRVREIRWVDKREIPHDLVVPTAKLIVTLVVSLVNRLKLLFVLLLFFQILWKDLPALVSHTLYPRPSLSTTFCFSLSFSIFSHPHIILHVFNFNFIKV